MLPAPENYGYKFQRIGYVATKSTTIDAKLNNVVDTRRSTTLSNRDVTVCMVEHVLAALRGLEIDNCLIQVSGSEIPVLDGSALPFCEGIQNIGILEQDVEREYIELDYTASSRLRVAVTVDFSGWTQFIGRQTAMWIDGPQEFLKEVAPARTFALFEEVEMLQKQGLLLGVNKDNTILFHKDSDEHYPPLRFPNEPCRHKLLDVVGDLALIGKPLKGFAVLVMPGHTRNIAYARALLLSSQLKQSVCR